MMTSRYRRHWIGAAALVLLSACSSGHHDPDPPSPAGNTPPTANAGADQVVAPGADVTLSAAASSDADGTIAAYAWTQTGGTSVTLSSASTATSGFTAPSTSGALTFQLTVTDNGGASHSDTITVTVNAPPTADAGADRTVSAGAAVSLTGSGTDSDGTIAGYAWTQTAGSAVTLNGAGTATLSFTAPATAASLTFQLTVTDDLGATHADAVTVTVTDAPPPPPPAAPVIGRQPTSPKAFEHEAALIFVAASGEDLTYEWYSVNFGTLVKSGPEPWLLRKGLGMSDDGNCYRAVISNSAGTVTSEPGCITVFAIEGKLDPYEDEDEGMGGDDQAYASMFGNSQMAVAELVAGALTGVSLQGMATMGVITGVPASAEPPWSCYQGSYVGATLDGVAITTAMWLPLGKHSVSSVWADCMADSDDLDWDDGGLLIEYDFPERRGEGSFTMYLSGYAYEGVIYNGVVHADVAHVEDNGHHADQIDIVLEADFSAPGARVVDGYPQTISIERRYSDDLMIADDTFVDFDVAMVAIDADGAAGTMTQTGGGVIRLRWVGTDGDSGEPSYISNEEFRVGLSGGFHLATLQAMFGIYDWGFTVLPPQECPDEPGNVICADQP